MSTFQNPSGLFEEVITSDGFRFKRRKTPKLENEFQMSSKEGVKTIESTNQSQSELNLKKLEIKNNDPKSMLTNQHRNQPQPQVDKELKKSDDLLTYNIFDSNIENKNAFFSNEETGKENIPRNTKEGIRREPPIREEIRQDILKREMKPFFDPIKEKERRVINLKESLEKLDKVLKMESEIGSTSGGRGLCKYPKLEKGEYLKNLEWLREINPEVRSGELFKEALKFENDRTCGLFKEWNVYSQAVNEILESLGKEINNEMNKRKNEAEYLKYVKERKAQKNELIKFNNKILQNLIKNYKDKISSLEEIEKKPLEQNFQDLKTQILAYFEFKSVIEIKKPPEISNSYDIKLLERKKMILSFKQKLKELVEEKQNLENDIEGNFKYLGRMMFKDEWEDFSDLFENLAIQ